MSMRFDLIYNGHKIIPVITIVDSKEIVQTIYGDFMQRNGKFMEERFFAKSDTFDTLFEAMAHIASP